MSEAIEKSPKNELGIPAVVYDCIMYIEQRGLVSEGIYRFESNLCVKHLIWNRISGVTSALQRLKSRYEIKDPDEKNPFREKTISVNLSIFNEDINTVAGVLKAYLRECTKTFMLHFD